MKVKNMTIIVYLLIISFPLFSQHLDTDDIRMYLDYARFRYDDNNTYLEIYYLLYNLDKSNADKPEPVQLDFELSKAESDSIIAAKTIEVDFNENGGEDPVSRGSLIKTVLPPGKYNMNMVCINKSNNQAIDTLSYDFKTAPFKKDQVSLSDLELCANILEDSPRKNAPYFKNTMEVFPNPTHIYGPENSNLYYYIELYNVNSSLHKNQNLTNDKSNTLISEPVNKTSASRSDKLNIQVAIKDDEGNIYEQKQYQRSRNYESLVEKGRFNISDLEDGLYTLMFAAVDPQAEYSVFRLNKFYVFNQQPQKSRSDLISLFTQSAYFNMAEEKVDKRFAQARYISSQKEEEVYSQLGSVDSKRMFMFKFWRERELENPGLQKEYYSRVKYANNHLEGPGEKGWGTDRGRVYIVYGEPSETIRRTSSSGDEPFEIWIYHGLEGGGRFLFVDELGNDDYELVSSTVRGEIYDPTWDEYLHILVE